MVKWPQRHLRTLEGYVQENMVLNRMENLSVIKVLVLVVLFPTLLFKEYYQNIDNNKGNVGWSIYGKKFDDETFVVSQNRPGILVMANSGRNTNQAQFYITTVMIDCCFFEVQANVAYLDKKLVAFGTVLEGMDVVFRIDMCGTAKGTPKWQEQTSVFTCSKVVIEDCGEIKENVNADLSGIKDFVPLSLREQLCVHSTVF